MRIYLPRKDAVMLNAEPESRSPLARFITGLLLAAVDVYAALAILYLGLRVLTGERFWPVKLANAFTPWILLPGFAALAACLALRQWRRALWAAIPAAAFVWLYGGLYAPRVDPPAACENISAGCMPIRVMTYNIASGGAPPDRVAKAVLAANPDVVLLQEVAPGVVAPLDAALSDAYPYRVFHGMLIYGKAVLSRYPIVEDSGLLPLASGNTYQRVILDVNGARLTVINAHPPRPSISGGQYRFAPGVEGDFHILAEAATQGGPTIMAGDFNAPDQSELPAILRRAGLADAHRQAGWGLGLTFSANRLHLPPLVRIDYVWLTPEIEAAEVHVGPNGGSDHLPVVADLVWRRPVGGAP
jgi:vancomycin resistance protein VanJ